MSGRRVMFVLGTTEGGTGRHVAMLAGGCARTGLAVTVAGPAQTRALLHAGPGQRSPAFEAVPISDRPRPVRDAACVRRMRRLVADAAPDVVHAHGMRAGALAALALRRAPRPGWPGGGPPALVVTLHNAAPAAPRAAAVYRVLERLVARRADAVLCVSSDLEARMRLLSARRVGRAIVPAPPAASASARPADLHPDGRPVVFAAGRLTAQKGFETLLAAAARWRDRQPEPLVVIAGTGPLGSDLAGQARGLGVGAVFLGWRDDVAALLAAADVVVLPSRWEGQPLVLQEALRAGRPVVAAAVGGVRDMTGDDAAVFVPPDDPAALAAAVLRVLDDPALARDLGAAAASRAAALPSEADAVAAVLAVYARLAGWGPSC